MDPLEILALIRGAEEIAVDIIPLFIHRDQTGKITAISIGAILEETNACNVETLRLIAEANAGKSKTPRPIAETNMHQPETVRCAPPVPTRPDPGR